MPPTERRTADRLGFPVPVESEGSGLVPPQAISRVCGWSRGVGRGGIRTRGGKPGRGLSTERAARPPMVSVVFPGCRDHPGIVESVVGLLGKALVTESTVEVLEKPFSQGLPGSILSVETPTRPSQARSSLAMTSGPLSLQKGFGAPRMAMRSARESITSAPMISRSTFSVRHSRVNSSITESHLIWLPLDVRSKMMSQHQTPSSDSARRRWKPLPPVPRQRLIRFFCIATRRPRCKSRNTRNGPARHL
jgi:hypothetical protein